jgi:ABC-type dipeptide/oligopeptide/nickel transport system permease subunit
VSTFLAYLRQRPGSGVAIGVLVVLALVSLFAPIVAPHDPNQTNLIRQFEPPSGLSFFGTDELGRDLFSRVLYGGQTALLTALGAVVLASLVGIPLGLVSGYFGGWIDAVAMRVVDVLLAIPSILIALGLIAMFGRGTDNVILAVGIVNIPAFARLTRATTLSVKERDYVQATQAMGTGYVYLQACTILPNAIGPILVQMAVTGATAILLASALSFLGLGIQPPTADWGTMLSIGRQHLFEAPWYGIFPGLAITITVYALDELSKALQDMLGTRLRAELGV